MTANARLAGPGKRYSPRDNFWCLLPTGLVYFVSFERQYASLCRPKHQQAGGPRLELDTFASPRRYLLLSPAAARCFSGNPYRLQWRIWKEDCRLLSTQEPYSRCYVGIYSRERSCNGDPSPAEMARSTRCWLTKIAKVRRLRAQSPRRIHMRMVSESLACLFTQ